MIKDKVVIITGASSGIGEATARLLANKGRAQRSAREERGAPSATIVRADTRARAA